MAYCDLTALREAVSERDLIQLTDDTDAQTAVNQTNIDGAIAWAGEIIDGYLRGRVPLPLDPVPQFIGDLAVDLALARLYGRRFNVEVPKSIQDKHDNAVKVLKEIQAGRLTLGVGEHNQPQPIGIKTNKTSDDRKFSRDVLDMM